MIQEFDAQGRLVKEWDYRSIPRRYREWDATGALVVDRGFNAVENITGDKLVAEEDGASSAITIRQQLRDGAAQLAAARDAAQADIATADSKKTQADSLSAAAATQLTQVQGFTPGATYKQSDMVAIRDALATVISRQKTEIDALSEGFGYRKAVDQNAVTTDNAIIGLAKIVGNALG